MLSLDTLRIFWPDTVAVLPGFFKDSVFCDRPFRISRDTVFVEMQAGDSCSLLYKPLPEAWIKPRALFRVESPEKGAAARIVKQDTARTDNLVISGTKTTSVNLNSGGTSLEDATGIRVSGSSMGVQVEGYIEETGFSDNQFTGHFAQLDRAYLRAQKGRSWLSVGNLSRTVELGHKTGQLRFMGMTGATSGFGAGAGYVFGQFKIKTFSGNQAFQGPYHLTEPGETVVESSQRVYLNGKLMIPDKDYTLDPVTGTLVFGPDRVIQAEDRIMCVFQVSRPGKNTYTAWATAGSDPVRVQAFGAWDRLSGIDPEMLQGVGDSELVLVPSGRFVGQGNGSYTKQDTVYTYAGPGNGDWDVSFTYVGDSAGDYLYDSFLGGYRFVGSGAGDYIPYIYLSPPARTRYAGVSGNLSKGNWNFSYSAAGTDRNGNTVSQTSNQRGLRAETAISMSSGFVDWEIIGSSRSSRFLHPFGNTTGQEDINWGMTDPGTGSRDQLQTMLRLKPLDWLSVAPELGYIRIAELSGLRWGSEMGIGPLSGGFRKVNLNSGSWIQNTWIQARGQLLSWAPFAKLSRQTGDTLDVWSGQANLSGSPFGTGVDVGLGYRDADTSQQLWASLRLWRNQHSISCLVRKQVGDSSWLQQQFQGRTGVGPGWISAGVDISASALTQERFIYVGPGQGDWAYDTSSSEFYHRPGGDYTRQRVLLDVMQPSVSQRVDAGISLSGFSLSGSGLRNLTGDSTYYQDYSGNLSLSGKRAFAQANAWFSADQTSSPGRRLLSGSAETGLRTRSGQPGLELFHEASWLDDQLERRVFSGGPYYRFNLNPSVAVKLFGGGMWAQDATDEGVFYHAGVEPDLSHRWKILFISATPNITYRWGKHSGPMTQVLLVYPVGLSYSFYGSVKLGTTGSLTLSAFLRGDETSLKDKGLSLSGSVVF